MSVYKGKREDAIDNYGDSRSQRYRTGASDKESASARSRHRDCDWEGARNRDRGQDHDIHHRERRVRERARDRSNDDYYRGQECDWQRDYGRHGEVSDRNRSRSREDGLEQLPVLLSRSRCKRKRVSGFDMAPPSTWMPGATSLPGHGNGTASAVPGMFPNIFPSVPAQVQAMTHQATRYARRVYVGGLSPSVNEQSMATFFNHVMSAIGGNTAGPGDAVVNVYINREKKFAFVEMRSVEEASNAIALDGIIFEGAAVKVGRPADYSPSSAATLGPTQPNPNLNLGAVGLPLGSAGGFQGPDRIFVGGIPYYLTEVQIRELLLSFGPLLAFNLVKDRETGNSRGYAFCVYEDLSVTDMACAALNGLKLGDKTLTVRRAKQGEQALQQIDLLKLMLQGGTMATKVLCLKQVLTTDMLKEDGEYEEILEDMRMECGKFGALVNLVIPRPSPKGEPSQGVGKIFVEYADIDSAAKAREGLNGRKFDGNKVVALFYPENKFFQGDYDA